jgi:Tfp pilus assembly protein PilO
VNASEMRERERRVLALGIASIVLILVLGRGLPAWLGRSVSVRASAANLVTKASRARSSVDHFQMTRDSLAARKRRLLALAPLMASGETPSVAGAKLASLIATTATESNLRLGSVQVRPDSGNETVFTRLTVRAEATGDVRGVTDFVRALEHGPKLLAVRTLSISQPEPNAPSDRVEALHLEVTVEALVPTPGSASKRDAATRSGSP